MLIPRLGPVVAAVGLAQLLPVAGARAEDVDLEVIHRIRTEAVIRGAPP